MRGTQGGEEAEGQTQGCNFEETKEQDTACSHTAARVVRSKATDTEYALAGDPLTEVQIAQVEAGLEPENSLFKKNLFWDIFCFFLTYRRGLRRREQASAVIAYQAVTPQDVTGGPPGPCPRFIQWQCAARSASHGSPV